MRRPHLVNVGARLRELLGFFASPRCCATRSSRKAQPISKWTLPQTASGSLRPRSEETLNQSREKMDHAYGQVVVGGSLLQNPRSSRQGL